MGIKGLFSILSSEPNRFGQRFITNRSDDVDIYIDAPALLYHLLHLHGQFTDNAKKRSCFKSYPQQFETIAFDDHRSRSGTPSSSCSSSLSSLLPPLPLPPRTIYQLTQAFCTTLKNSIGHNSTIHLVVDGVASVSKMKQQVDRLRNIAVQLDERVKLFQARSTRVDTKAKAKTSTSTSTSTIPHLFGEDAMIQAVKDLQTIENNHGYDRCCGEEEEKEKEKEKEEEGHTHFAVHFAPFEAEGYIAHSLIGKGKKGQGGVDERQQIVLSNDSDFLVFPSITGIIPFHSLDYVLQDCDRTPSDSNPTSTCNTDVEEEERTGDNSNWDIHGWIYLRKKFTQAFSLESGEQMNYETEDKSSDILVMSTIAALAGCDYTLSGKCMYRLNDAAQTIIKSDIGGLRQKHRNSPSARDTITAVIRFVQHFTSRNNKKSIINGSQCINRDNELWLKKLVEAVVKIEVSSNQKGGKCKSKNMLKRQDLYKEEQQKLLENALYTIRDVYNDNCSESALSTIEHSSRFCYMQELRRLVRYNTIFLKPVIEIQRFQSNDENDDNYRRGSLWTTTESAFVQCRARIYSLIKCCFNKERAQDCIDVTVKEYCISTGPNDSVDYTPFTLDIESVVENCKLFLSSCYTDPMKLLIYIFCGYHQGDKNMLSHLMAMIDTQQHNEWLFLTSLLLDLNDALVLFLMAFTPKFRTLNNFDESCYETFSSEESLLQSQSLIQIAAFHAKLGIETVECIVDNRKDRNEEITKLPVIEYSAMYKIFRGDATIRFLWFSVINACGGDVLCPGRCTVEDDQLSMILEEICSKSDLGNECDEWQKSVVNLWKTRLKFEEMRYQN